MEGRPLILEKKVPNRFLASLAAQAYNWGSIEWEHPVKTCPPELMTEKRRPRRPLLAEPVV